MFYTCCNEWKSFLQFETAQRFLFIYKICLKNIDIWVKFQSKIFIFFFLGEKSFINNTLLENESPDAFGRLVSKKKAFFRESNFTFI